jgi:hypothetical protein
VLVLPDRVLQRLEGAMGEVEQIRRHSGCPMLLVPIAKLLGTAAEEKAAKEKHAAQVQAIEAVFSEQRCNMESQIHQLMNRCVCRVVSC